jgi:hypothetical protein
MSLSPSRARHPIYCDERTRRIADCMELSDFSLAKEVTTPHTHETFLSSLAFLFASGRRGLIGYDRFCGNDMHAV